MKRIVFAVPGDLATPTGGYAYDRHIVAGLADLGWSVEVVDVGGDFPRPGARTLAAARTKLCAVAAGTKIVIDGLAFGAMPKLAAELAGAHALIALVHHPLALETGLSAADADRFRASERAALATTSGVIVNSPSTARLLASDYGVAPGKIAIVLPGNEPRPQARGGRDGVIVLLAVGSLVPRKGYDVLVAAASVSPAASRCWARCRTRASPSSMRAPTSSCCRRASRDTAWRSPMRSPTAFP